MSFDPPGQWPPNVTLHPKALSGAADAQRRAFDELTAQIHDARARELRDYSPAPPSSEELVCKLMALPAANGMQLGTKLKLFALELAKEADFGQNPDLRLMPFFAAIQRDCILLLNAQLPDDSAFG